MRAIIHLDMDAFYASVEQRDDPRLRGRPVIVGGHAQRGVVLAASYEVRPLGVRSAMPMARALKAAPNAIVVPPRFLAYAEASRAVFAIFARYTPEIEPLSLDEAFLDVTGSLRLFGTPSAMAHEIRQAVAKEVHLPVSAGIACVKFIAKIASDLAKPNGQREVQPTDTVAFLAPLPIARLWGVGPKTEERLRALGLRTIGDVAARSERWMEEHIGRQGEHFWRLSQGIDPRPVESDRVAKSIGAEDTFEEDLPLGEVLWPRIHSQALRVADRLRDARLTTRTVQLKLKWADFTVLTRRETWRESTDDGALIYKRALALLQRMPAGKDVRLTGVSAQDLVQDDPQGVLFAPAAVTRAGKLNSALDQIQEKFGRGAVVHADLLPERKPDSRDERCLHSGERKA